MFTIMALFLVKAVHNLLRLGTYLLLAFSPFKSQMVKIYIKAIQQWVFFIPPSQTLYFKL